MSAASRRFGPGAHRAGSRVLVALALLVVVLVEPPAAPAAAKGDGRWEWFTGTVEEFYVVPDPLPRGRPGQLIRVQPVAATADHVTVRIMYHSEDAAGRDRAVTGTLTYPTATPPPGGWPVVSTANGTVGMAPRCALSRRARSAPSWGLPAVAVATDYIGLGPVGERHPYLSRVSEGNSVIDAVRAARDLRAAGAGRRWMAIGGSQGGHGALSANELGAARAPELDLLGSVAMAPGAMFDRSYGGLDPFIIRVLSAMGLYGAETEHPEIVPEDYVTPAVTEVAGVVDTGCLPEITAAFLGVPFDDFYVRDPLRTEPARSIMLANDVGLVAVDEPALVVQGTADTTVVAPRTRDLVARMCRTGQVVEHLEVPGADHGNVGVLAYDHIHGWLRARLSGEPPPDSCPPPLVAGGTGSVVEGDRGTVALEVPVTLDRPARTRVTVRWRTEPGAGLAGRATPGVDHLPASGTVRFRPGETGRRVVVRVRGDRVAEGDEVVTVRFSDASGAVIGGGGLATGTIVDDDGRGGHRGRAAGPR